MRKLIFCGFLLWGLLVPLALAAFELSTTAPLYYPGSTISASVSWEAGAAEDRLFLTLTLPGGRLLFLTPSGPVAHEQPFSGVDLGREGSATLFSFTYPEDSWLPPGRYLLSARRLSPDGVELSRAEAAFELTSHFIPLTFEGHDPPVRSFKAVAAGEGYWITFAGSGSLFHKHIHALRISPSGRTLIPPFETGLTCDDNYPGTRYYLAPSEDGGFYLLATGYEHSRYPLVLARFDARGRRLYKKVLLKGGRAEIQPWFHRTAGGFLVLFRQGGALKLFNSSAAEPRTLAPDTDAYFPAYDEATGRLLVIYTQDREAYLLVLDAQGEEILREALPDFGSGDTRAPLQEPFRRGEKFCLLRPQGSSDSFLFCFDATGALERREIPGLSMGIYGRGAYSVSYAGDTAEVIWRASGTAYYYARFLPEDGTLLLPPARISFDTGGRPQVFSQGERSLFVVQDDGTLGAFFLGYDFPRGPDLVLAETEVEQHPGPFATLGGETRLHFTIANRGEGASPGGSLTLSYLGESQEVEIPPVAKGASVPVEIRLSQPPFLTTRPVYTARLEAEEPFQENNAFESEVLFAPNTPIFPEGSALYSWQVLDAATGDPVPAAHLRYTLPELPLISGERKALTLTARADADGHLQTVLPPGTYRFLLYHGGYPRKFVTVEVPGAGETLYLEPPGSLRLSFTEAGGGALHPLPRVTVSLAHLEDPSLPDWQEYLYEAAGPAEGVVLSELMPGAYRLTAQAFGYQRKEETVQVTGGQETSLQLELTPLPRTTVSGQVVSGGSGLSRAEVQVVGYPYRTTTDRRGNFSLTDFPVDPTRSYRLLVSKEGFQSRVVPFSVETENETLPAISLRQIYRSTFELARCRYAAWVQDAEWSVQESYAIHTIYGVWDMEGALHYQQLEGAESLDLDEFDLSLSGLRWGYWGLEADLAMAFLDWFLGGLEEVSEVVEYLSQAWEAYDWAETPASFLVTYEGLADPLGTVRGGVIDCGELDTLADLSPPDPDDPADLTVIRVDDLRVYDGEELLFHLRDLGPVQFFSTDYEERALRIPIQLTHPVSSAANLRIYLYVFVENGNGESAPLDLYGVNRLRFEWGVENGRLVLKGLVPDPPDYPEM